VLRDLGFRYLATYAMDMPPSFTQKPPDSYVYDSTDSTSKAMLIQQGAVKGTAFQSIYPDGMLLVTMHGMPASPVLSAGQDALYQVLITKGTLPQAWDSHTAQVAALSAFHGDPLKEESADSYRRLMDDIIVNHSHKRVARTTVKLLRGAALAVIGMLVLMAIPLLLTTVATGTSISPIQILAPTLGGGILCSPAIITALVLAARIKRKYL
jgi:hypothetical protein